MIAWEEGMDLSGVSIGDHDAENGSPKVGDYIAYDKDNPEDQWLVNAEFHAANYVEIT